MAILAVGILMSMSGATLAITGVASNDDASVAEYTSPNEKTGGNDVAGEDQGGEGPAGTEQVAATGGSSGSLPFTGFLAIPLLIGGVALTGTGFVLRRKAAGPDAA